MNSIAIKRSCLAQLVAACAILLGAMGSAAAAAPIAADPVAVCDATGKFGDVGMQTASSGDQLTGTASAIEAMLTDDPDQVSAGDRSIAMLRAASPAAATPAAMAAYCAAAGEAFRLGKGGSPYQARKLLRAAYRLAGTAGREELRALAAYRLGLLNLGGFATGARGLRRAALRSPLPQEGTPEAVPESADPGCMVIDRRATSAPDTAFVSVNALKCAISGARTANAFEIGAKASVRLARFWLDHGRRTPAEQAASRSKAAVVALDALDRAGQVADLALRFDLLGRLVDAAIDSGDATSDPRLQEIAQAMSASAADKPQQSQAAALQARLALARGDDEAARRQVRQAIFLESQNSLPLRLPDWFLLLAQADPAHRSEHLTAAFRALNSVRPLLPRFDATTAESNFTLRVQPVFEALLADRLTGDSENPDDPVRIAEAQALVEEYRQAC